MLFKEITATVNGNGYPRAEGNDPSNWRCKPAGVNNPDTPGCEHIIPVPLPPFKPINIGIECVVEVKP